MSFPPLAELVPADGTIRLTVPPATQPGEYQVELTGRNEDDRPLTATMSLSVSPVTLPKAATSRNPVILLNGFQLICTDSASTLAASVGTFGQMASLLQTDGAPVAFFNNCSYGDIPIEQLAAQLKTYLAGLTYTDGSPVTQVDIVAHSMGGLVTRAYLAGLQTDGSLLPPENPRVGKVILIGTPNFGSFQAPRVGTQAPELVPGSTFLWSLARWNQGQDDLRGIDALAVIGNAGSYYSPANFDDGVVSLTSGSLSFARPDQRTRVVPYCHVTPGITTAFGTIGMNCAGAQGIADIDQPSHQTAQIVRSSLSGTSDWTSIGQTPSQMPWWSEYGGVYFAVENASGSEYYNDLTQVSLGTIALNNGGAANAVFYNEFIKGAGTFQFSSSSLGTASCGSFTVPSGYYFPVRCKYGPNITSVTPLMSNVSGIQIQSGANVTISGNGFGQQCANCKVVASPGNNALTVSSWSDKAITALLPASLAGLVQLAVQASGGSDSINIMAASGPQGSAPVLSISKIHNGTFTLGQAGAAYTVTVSNAVVAGPTTGTVTVTEAVPSGLTLASMAGSGWNCSGPACTRADTLSAGAEYPPITVTVNVASNPPSQLTNQVTVSGGGSVSSSASDVTVVTSGLAAPVLASPANGSTGVFLGVILTWGPSGGAVSYDVYFGASSSPPFATNTPGMSYTPGGLSPSATYYWRIVAKNAAGSTTSPTWSFTTQTTASTGQDWAHTWGGSKNDIVASAAIDAAGNIYLAGSTSSYGAGGQDVLLLKYDSTGHLLWNRVWGGTADDSGSGVAVDSSGNVYVAGSTQSFGFGRSDALLLKFNSSGSLLWAKTWGGSSYDAAYDLAFDSSGNVYVAGESYSLGNCAIFLKFDSNGNLLFTRTWKGPATYDSAYSVDVDKSGNVVLAGVSWDYSSSPNHNSILVLKFDNQGTFLWNRNLVSGAQDEAGGAKTVRFDAGGNIFIGGHRAASCQDSDFSKCNFDVEIAKLDSNGGLGWAKSWGGPGFESVGGLAFDPNGNLIVNGSTQSTLGGTTAAMLLSFDSSGNLLKSRAWTEGSAVGGSGVATDGTGTIVLTGSASSASGAWADVAGSSSSLSPSLTTPSGSAGSSTGGLGTPTGSLASPTGVADSGGGGQDGLVVRTTSAPAAPVTVPVITAFQNAATFEDGGVDGSWVAIMGSNLAPDTPAGRVWTNDDFTSTSMLPTVLDGVSVTVDGKAAAVYYLSPTQINIQVPATGKTGPVNVLVTTSKGVSAPFTGQIAAYAPGLFMLSQGGFKYPAAVTSDGTYLGPTGLLGSAAVTRPARPGESISLYATGLGPTSPAIAPGTWGWAPAQTSQTVTAMIGGIDAHVDWSGLVSAGEYQINVVVPQGLADGEYPTVLRLAGVSTQGGVFVAVQSSVGQNPVPNITSLSPSSATAGTSSLTLTINGAGLIPSSTVTFAGTARAASLISSGQLTITLTSADLAGAGSYAVVVTNPAPGGGSSGPVNFVVTSPTPALQALNLSTTSVIGGNSLAATVILSARAPAGGVVVNLSAGSTVAQVPASVTVPAGSSTAPFTVTTSAVGSVTTVNIVAELNSNHRAATLTINPPSSSGIVLQGKGFQIDGTLTISGTALRFEIQAVPTGAAHLITIDDGFALPSYPQLLVQYTATGSISGNTATFTSTSVTGLYESDPAELASLNSATLVINFTSSSAGSPVTGTLTLSTSGGTVQATFTGNLTAIG
jgi:uncharacterized protein (TIGR03437 family)